MFIYEIVGYSFIESKELFVLYLQYDSHGVKGKAVEVVFVKQQFVEGGRIDVGQLCRVFRNQKGYVQGVEIV